MAGRPRKPHRRRKARRGARLLALAFAAMLLVGAAALVIGGVVLGIRALALGIRAMHGVLPIPAATAAPTNAPPFSSAFVKQGVPWTDAGARQVAGIAAPIVNGPAFPSTTSVIIADPRSGQNLYAHNAHAALVPASTIKLIVAAAALKALGPAHRFETALVTNGAVAGGAVRGDVYLVGGGDPMLATDDLRAATRVLRREGINAIDGDIVADGTLYGPDAVNATWDPDDLLYGWAAPPSAVTIDNGSVQFTITPDPDGSLASVAVEPPGAAGRVVGNVRTASEGADNTLHIDPLPDGSGFALSGQIPYGAPQKYWRAIAHPTDVAARVVRAVALGGGIAVAGAPSSGKAPAGAITVLWSHRSPPLTDIVHRMAFDSDNHVAEQLLRAVGANAFGSGTLANGLRAERQFLTSMDADDRGTALVDGSGLSGANRVSAATLAAALRSMLAGADARSEALLLPRVGVEGTVRFRPLAPDVADRVRGKDGYIEGASGLAGYVVTAHHGVIVYAFLVNGWQEGLDAIWAGEDEILARLARL